MELVLKDIPLLLVLVELKEYRGKIQRDMDLRVHQVLHLGLLLVAVVLEVLIINLFQVIHPKMVLL